MHKINVHYKFMPYSGSSRRWSSMVVCCATTRLLSALQVPSAFGYGQGGDLRTAHPHVPQVHLLGWCSQAQNSYAFYTQSLINGNCESGSSYSKDNNSVHPAQLESNFITPSSDLQSSISIDTQDLSDVSPVESSVQSTTINHLSSTNASCHSSNPDFISQRHSAMFGLLPLPHLPPSP